MPVLLSMAFAVIIWSFYPYAAVLGLQTMNGAELIFLTTIIASLSISIITFFYFLRRNRLQIIIENHKKISRSTWLAIIGSGITLVLCHSLFFVGLSMSNKAGVSLIYESWPIIAVIMTPLFIHKKWKEVDFKDFIVSLVAMGGVVIVVLSNDQIELPFNNSHDLSAKADYSTLIGYILAFVGAYACGINVVLKGLIAENFRKLNHQNGAIIISEFHSRFIALIIMVIFLPFYISFINFENFSWLPGLYIGFVVMILGGALYTYALINTDLPTIHILYYFVPLLAVFILWYFGESDVNLGLFLGGGLIIVANIYLYFSGRAAKYST